MPSDVPTGCPHLTHAHVLLKKGVLRRSLMAAHTVGQERAALDDRTAGISVGLLGNIALHFLERSPSWLSVKC